MKLFWCSWEIDEAIEPNDTWADVWPNNMEVYVSGSGDDYVTYCAAIVAEDEEDVWKQIRALYGDAGDCIRERIEPDEITKPMTTDRFPGLREWTEEQLQQLS